MTYKQLKVEYAKPIVVQVRNYTTVDYGSSGLAIATDFREVGTTGWSMGTVLEITGGPDRGKRVEVLRWLPEDSFDYIREVYNGTPEEADTELGYSARPCIRHVGTLNVVTVVAIKTWLKYTAERDRHEHLMKALEASFTEALS